MDTSTRMTEPASGRSFPAPSGSPVITVEDLQVRYGDTIAVDGISFWVEPGEIFGLLGPNGAGKTTTVETLQGLRKRSGGHIDVLDLDPQRSHDRLRKRIGSQLQSSALPERLRVREAISLFAKAQDVPVDVDSVLETWDLAPLRRRPFATLSGGQRQRLFLALALLGSPEIVFLDELTTALDPQARRATWDLVRAIRGRGATVVLVTHLMEEAEALCDRVAIVDHGAIVALDTPSALTSTSGGDVRTTFTIQGETPRYLSGIPGVRTVSRDGDVLTVTGESTTAATVAAALIAHDASPRDYRTHYPTLEDVFLAQTGRTLTEEDRQ